MAERRGIDNNVVHSLLSTDTAFNIKTETQPTKGHVPNYAWTVWRTLQRKWLEFEQMKSCVVFIWRLEKTTFTLRRDSRKHRVKEHEMTLCLLGTTKELGMVSRSFSQ